MNHIRPYILEEKWSKIFGKVASVSSVLRKHPQDINNGAFDNWLSECKEIQKMLDEAIEGTHYCIMNNIPFEEYKEK
jgi:glycine cleavage system H lipoate-binding protein